MFNPERVLENKEKESGEPKELTSFKVFMEIVKDGIKKKYISSPENVQILSQNLKELEQEGIKIPALEEMRRDIENMEMEAIGGALSSSLEIFDQVNNNDRSLKLSWYYKVEELFKKNQDKLNEEDGKKTENWLKENAEKLGLN